MSYALLYCKKCQCEQEFLQDFLPAIDKEDRKLGKTRVLLRCKECGIQFTGKTEWANDLPTKIKNRKYKKGL